jgi:hypothetical protein
MSITPQAIKARDLLEKVTFNLDLSEFDAKLAIRRINDAYATYPISYKMWRDWKVLLYLLHDERAALNEAQNNLEPYIYNLSWLPENPAMGPKLTLPGWKTLIERVNAKKERLWRELQPESVGLTPDYVRGRIIATNFWQKNVHQILSSWNDFQQPKKTGAWCMMTYRDDSGTAPYLVYIPKKYKATTKSPLMMHFYGGWISSDFSRSWATREFIIDNPNFAPRNFLEENNMVCIVPMLNSKHSPLTNAGIKAIRSILAEVKTCLNIDDNRVYATGFSDGGTALYEVCRTNPTDFAALFPMSGWPRFKFNLRNMGNRPLTGYFAEHDDLYNPLGYARSYSLFKKECPGWEAVYVKNVGHDSMFYSDSVIPDIYRIVSKTSRDPFPKRIQIEGAPGDINRLDWLEITGVDPQSPAQPWQNEITFQGRNPQTGEVKTYISNEGNGMAIATRSGNVIEINASRVTGLKLYLHPSIFDLAQPIKVIVNGEVKHDGNVSMRDADVLHEFLSTMDRTNLPEAILTLNLSKPPNP